MTKHSEHQIKSQETENGKLQNLTDQRTSKYTNIRNDINLYKLCNN